jgi:hypothetical protein
VRFHVLTAASMKMSAYSILVASIIRTKTHRPEDGGSNHLRNCGRLLPEISNNELICVNHDTGSSTKGFWGSYYMVGDTH